jgi:hypothetical protein
MEGGRCRWIEGMRRLSCGKALPCFVSLACRACPLVGGKISWYCVVWWGGGRMREVEVGTLWGNGATGTGSVKKNGEGVGRGFS